MLHFILFLGLLLTGSAHGLCSFEAIRSIDARHQQFQSWMGSASSAHFSLSAGNGCARHYQQGSIYYHPCAGAFEIHGLIRNLWASKGWEKGFLGYPLSDELPMTDGRGRVSLFQGGAVYYHPDYGTFAMTENFHRLWRDKGGVGGLGYATAEMKCHLGMDICSQSFQRGILSLPIGKPATEVDLRKEISRRGIGVRDQGSRPTCSVFTITFLLEYGLSGKCGRKFNNLSEQFLNHATNLVASNKDDGDFFHNIVKGYSKYGISSEASLPYQSSYKFEDVTLQVPVIAEAILNLNNFRLKSTFVKPIGTPMGLSETEHKAVISALNRGIPVGLGRSHSMVIVGYRLDSKKPGGGEYLFRNSYGLGTGDHGYQYEDFASVQATANDALIFEPNS